ncbi:hypothetical protein Tco_0387430 [Tanacetum coccineum]
MTSSPVNLLWASSESVSLKSSHEIVTSSPRRHFKSLSLDELRSPNFNLFSDQEYSEEEEAEAMAETMEQILDSIGYVPTKTAADAKTAIQEMAEYSQKWHNRTSRGISTETSDGLAAI